MLSRTWRSALPLAAALEELGPGRTGYAIDEDKALAVGSGGVLSVIDAGRARRVVSGPN
jgi:hypothetical protein